MLCAPPKGSAIEDMIVDLRDARLAPARRDIARVKEERARGVILPAAVAGDLCDRNGLVQQRRVAHRGHPAAAHEAELARKSGVLGKSVSVRVDLGGRRFIKKKIRLQNCASRCY